MVGVEEGALAGILVGGVEGMPVGNDVGAAVGIRVGDEDGTEVGEEDGCAVADMTANKLSPKRTVWSGYEPAASARSNCETLASAQLPDNHMHHSSNHSINHCFNHPTTSLLIFVFICAGLPSTKSNGRYYVLCGNQLYFLQRYFMVQQLYLSSSITLIHVHLIHY
jgi:hypothetical protein